jgi:hypothetical protein
MTEPFSDNITPPIPSTPVMEEKPVRIRVTPYGIKLAFFHRTEVRRPLKVSIPFEQWQQMSTVISDVDAGQRFEGFFGFTPETLALHRIDAVPLPEPAPLADTPPEPETTPLAIPQSSSLAASPETLSLAGAHSSTGIGDAAESGSGILPLIVQQTPPTPTPSASPADSADSAAPPLPRRVRPSRKNTTPRARPTAGNEDTARKKAKTRPRLPSADSNPRQAGRAHHPDAARTRRKGVAAHE